MPKGIGDKLTFKPYDQGQIELIPPTAEAWVQRTGGNRKWIRDQLRGEPESHRYANPRTPISSNSKTPMVTCLPQRLGKPAYLILPAPYGFSTFGVGHMVTTPNRWLQTKGYGSLENYQHLENQKIEAYIKYPHWDQEKKKRSNKYRYRSWRFVYDEKTDELICPEGERAKFIEQRRRRNYTGTDTMSIACIDVSVVLPAKSEQNARNENTAPLSSISIG